jgi:hypothetical protein
MWLTSVRTDRGEGIRGIGFHHDARAAAASPRSSSKCASAAGEGKADLRRYRSNLHRPAYGQLHFALAVGVPRGGRGGGYAPHLSVNMPGNMMDSPSRNLRKRYDLPWRT